MQRVDVRARLRHDVPLIVLWALVPIQVMVTVDAVRTWGWGWDSHAYWLAAHNPDIYGTAPGTIDAFSYSPAFAQAIMPLAALPWPVFAAIWSTAAAAVLAWLLRPLGWPYGLALWLWCSWEIVSGNIHWLFAVVAACGIRYPALWALPALTKITPGVGIVWFVVRRQWRQVAQWAFVTAAVVGLSFAANPQAWYDWFGFLASNVDATAGATGLVAQVPPVVRASLAALLVTWGGLTERRWTVPAATALAMPVWGAAALVVFAALPSLYRRREATTVPPQPEASS